MVKRCLTPQVWQTRISPTILKFTFSQHMVEDDWPWWRLLHGRPFTREGNYLFFLLDHNDLTTGLISINQSICLVPRHWANKFHAWTPMPAFSGLSYPLRQGPDQAIQDHIKLKLIQPVWGAPLGLSSSQQHIDWNGKWSGLDKQVKEQQMSEPL